MRRNDQSIYSDYARHWWDGTYRFQRLLLNQVRARMMYFDRLTPSSWEGLRVLDLGCGGGFMSEALARRGARVVGVDPCAELLDVARSHALSSGFSIDYREGEGEAVPLEDASVDRVVCVDVLEHVRSLPRVLEEARRVLRPGGLFFFDTINRNWIARLLAVHVAEDALGMLPRGTHDPSRFVRPRELQRELERCGFSRLVGKFTGMGPIGINRRLDFEFGLLPCTWILYLGCAA